MSATQILGDIASDLSGEVALSWSDTYTNETGFEVKYRLLPTDSWSVFEVTAPDVTETTVTGLLPSTIYSFCIFALIPGDTNSPGLYSYVAGNRVTLGRRSKDKKKGLIGSA